MKKRILIITAVIIANILAFSIKSDAQQLTAYQSNQEGETVKVTTLIADETTLTETKTGAKIETTSDKVHFKLYEKWQHVFTRYSWTWKKDRHGPYKQYVITISSKDAELIKIWAKDNL